MNKVEFIKLVKSLELPTTEYCILSGGSLLLHNVRETNDLDIDVTEKGFEILKRKFNVKLKNKGNQQYQITKDIECFVSEKLDTDIDFIDGYPCQTLMTVYKFKIKMNRPKDQQDIVNLRRVLNIN